MPDGSPASTAEVPPRRAHRPRRWLRRIVVLAGVVVALLVAGVVALLLHSRNPTPDAFYTPPSPLPPTRGAVIRSEPYTRAMPAGSRAWRVLYTSTDDAGAPVAVSALVIAPAHPPSGPRPVLAWAHGTTGVTPPCAPSVSKNALAGIPDMARALAAGWVLVLTDYPGLGTPGVHPYLVGASEAHAVLDSVRAAHNMGLGFPLDPRYAVWGHSQGGHAALFAAALAPTYMPEYRLVGVAALAPATNLVANFKAISSTGPGKLLTIYAIYSWSRHYPGVSYDAIVAPDARRAADRIAKDCLNTPTRVLVAVSLRGLPSRVTTSDIATDPKLRPLFDENSPGAAIAAPLFVAQGAADQVVSPPVTHAWFAGFCAAGHSGELHDYPGVDHVGVTGPGGADALAWIADRFAGKPAPTACHAA